ncbi:MAG: ABC transporter permease [Lachnospiraceae bacterium]|nr:ABC transporter permease [Lachnospiraceae bacterium]
MENRTKNNETKKNGNLISTGMLLFEFRNVIGNPYIHIFGVGMPIMMVILISRVVATEITDGAMLSNAVTSIFLGIGTMIPMATVLMGYGIARARELERGIPLRMELFGVNTLVTLCNNALAEMVYMLIAFCIYFPIGFGIVGAELPKASGVVLYMVCILALSIIMFCLAYAISSLLKKFSLTYCVTMFLYFGFMILGGMMGITYDNMPEGMQAVAQMLPITYINKDFYMVWKGESYNFMPMVQSYLLLAAIAGILMMVSLKKTARKKHKALA